MQPLLSLMARSNLTLQWLEEWDKHSQEKFMQSGDLDQQRENNNLRLEIELSELVHKQHKD